MKEQVKGKMFLADERGVNETDWFRSWNTFNFGKFYNEHKKSFGDMYVLNDDTLAAGKSIKMLVEENSYVFILPVAGAINYRDSLGNENLIAAGQGQLFLLGKGESMELSNPFEEELVNFLQVWIKAGNDNSFIAPQLSTYDDVNENIDNLVSIFSQNDLPISAAIGKFNGRGEANYNINKNSGTFVFIIEGAFEVEGRLLHERDGLALWQSDSFEMEALSNDAILLVIELPLNLS